MDKLLYVAMTGASQMMNAQSTHANNLANVDTQGFKADFVQARSQPLYGETFATRVFSQAEQPGTDFASGPMQQTNNPLDMAIKGEGFFTVLDEQGEEAFTREGSFFVDVNGFMRNNKGQIAMGNAGPMIIPPYETLEIGVDGSVSIRPLGQDATALVEIDRLKMVNPELEQIEKSQDGLFRRKDQDFEPPAAGVRVQSGFTEGSNVNPVHSLLSIMSLSRQFELSMKVMSQAETMDQASSQLLRP